ADRLGLDEATRGVVYYVGLIAWVGCHVDAYEQAKGFGDGPPPKGDDPQGVRTPSGSGRRPGARVRPHPPGRGPAPGATGTAGRQVPGRGPARRSGDTREP